jgi:hypothetical protein|tara:strand:+ start:331 stop:489 length:159 start_codon:yes stop_codon:yes gene_type:complete
VKIFSILLILFFLSGCSYGLHLGKKCLVSKDGTAWSYVWFAESGARLTECKE